MPKVSAKQTPAVKASSRVIKSWGNFVGGRWVTSKSSQVIHDLNPANTEEELATFPQSTREEARAAVESAKKAFPSWRATPAPARARIFARAAALIQQRADHLAETMTREEGKILSEAKGEILKGLNLVEFYSGEGWRLEGKTLPSEMPSTFTYTVRQPLGVVALISPWNFPFAIPCWKIAPALVAGNTAVFKPASLTPLTAALFVEILQEAGLPDGVLNFVTGLGGTVGHELVTHPAVRAVSFTGSNAIGAGINRLASERGVKVTCEMGGKNPAIVWDDADLDLALAGVVKGAFGSTGQRCTATSRLVIHEAVHDRFVDMLVAEAKKIVVGNGLDPKVGMGPAVDQSQMDTDLRYIDLARQDGARLVFGGRRLKDGALAKGYFVEPAIFTGVTPTMRIAQEEVFGPVLSVIKVTTFDEAMKVANDVQYGLTCAIYTADANRIMRYTEEAEVGMVHINSPTIGGEAQLPFGGIKATGVGEREMAQEGINFFTHLKTVFFDYTGRKRETNIY